MPPKSTIKEAKNGYRVIAIAGIIGSGNILVTKSTEMSWPKSSTIAIYMKEVKCESLMILKMPQNESKSKVAPLKKYEIKSILIVLKQFTKSIDRKGG